MKTMFLSNASRRVLALCLLGAIAAGTVSSAAAAEFRTVPSAHIRYGDLNLESVTGLNLLYKRIVIAAYEVCQPFGHDHNDNADSVAIQQCRDRIIAAAVTKLDKPALYALYHARNSKRPPAPILSAERQK